MNDMLPPLSPSWSPSRYADRRGALRARNLAQRAMRDYFAGADFLEVETPILQISPGNETHLHAFATEYLADIGTNQPLYLRTSPEFAAKKLLAAGENRLFEFAKSFRNREISALHHPEFTMLEWYRAGEDYCSLMMDCERLIGCAAKAMGAKTLAWRGKLADPFLPFQRLSVAEAFQLYAGIDLLASVPDGNINRAVLSQALRAQNIRQAGDDTWSDLFSRVMVEKIEPQLGQGRVTILYDYPAPEAALARLKPDDPRIAERFELYACGVELANAFTELTNPEEQQTRFEVSMLEKQRLYGEQYPIDADFIAALAIMPQAAGCALGFDRLMMLLTNARHISDVLALPVMVEAR